VLKDDQKASLFGTSLASPSGSKDLMYVGKVARCRARRYPEGLPDKLATQHRHELNLIERLE
jgi:hypothetical protein